MNKKQSNSECVIYLRLSKEDNKTDESSSIVSQRMIIESFCRFNGFIIREEYVDDGYSGGNFNRPAFTRMITDIEQGKITCVITKDLSRLGREMYGTGGYIEDYFLEKGVRYIAINDSFDTENGDYSMLGIRLGVNDLYLRDVSKKVRSSIRIKQEAGEYIGSFPLYGYMKDPDDKHHLIIDWEVVPVIKLIYSLALEGYGMNTICHRLTDMNIPIPIVHKKEPRASKITDNNGNGIWKHATVRNILTSQMYIGNMVQHTFTKASYRSKRLKKIDESDYIIIKNTHEPIVSEEDFFKVQELLKGRSRYTVKKEDKYMFTGLLKCKECGTTISISEKKNKKNNSHYTQCNLYRRKGKYGLCTQHRINYNELEEDLLDILKNTCSKFLKDYNYEKMLAKKEALYEISYKSLEDEVKKIESNITKQNGVIDSIYKDKLEGIISADDFSRMYNIEKQKSDFLKKQLEDMNKKINDLKESNKKDTYSECKEIVEAFMKLKNPTRNVVARLVDRVEISEDKKVDIYFKFKDLSAMLD